MLPPPNLYQSIFSRLSVLTIDQLQQLDAYLKALTEGPDEEANRANVMEFAGAQNDLSEEFFADVRTASKTTGAEPPNRDVAP